MLADTNTAVLKTIPNANIIIISIIIIVELQETPQCHLSMYKTIILYVDQS